MKEQMILALLLAFFLVARDSSKKKRRDGSGAFEHRGYMLLSTYQGLSSVMGS